MNINFPKLRIISACFDIARRTVDALAILFCNIFISSTYEHCCAEGESGGGEKDAKT